MYSTGTRGPESDEPEDIAVKTLLDKSSDIAPGLYTLRYTWSVPEGMKYPAESFEEADSEEQALFAAGWASRSLSAWGGLAVAKVEICRADGPWRVVFSKDEA
jgi:hypothetical protein